MRFSSAIESSEAYVIDHRQQDSREEKEQASYLLDQPELSDPSDESYDCTHCDHCSTKENYQNQPSFKHCVLRPMVHDDRSLAVSEIPDTYC